MIREDEDALICDLAETYQVYDYRSLPLRLVATLAAGLREGSRILSNTTEVKASTENTILAIIADNLCAIRKLLGDKTELHSIVAALYRLDEKKKEMSRPMSFRSGAEFMEEWRAINED